MWIRKFEAVGKDKKWKQCLLNFNKLGVQILINDIKAYWDKQKKNMRIDIKRHF